MEISILSYLNNITHVIVFDPCIILGLIFMFVIVNL